MRAVADRDRVDAGASRHAQVVRRVADHQQVAPVHCQLPHQFHEHRRIRLGARLVAAARSGEQWAEPARLQRALQSAEVKERLAKLGTEAMSMSPAESDAFIRREHGELGKIMLDAGLTPQ